MSENRINDTSVQCYLSFAQNIIARLAGNSANAKTWCVTLVAGLLALAAGSDKGLNAIIKICYLPVILFCSIDMYYLFLERYFRAKYDEIISKSLAAGVSENELFKFKGPPKTLCWDFIRSIGSPSIWPFYISQIAVLTYILW